MFHEKCILRRSKSLGWVRSAVQEKVIKTVVFCSPSLIGVGRVMMARGAILGGHNM